MSGSADLYRKLKSGSFRADTESDGIGGLSDNYMTPGGTHECHPDFVATPIGKDPYGFLICRRKKDLHSAPQEVTYSKYSPILSDVSHTTNQTYDLFSNDPNQEPRRTRLGGQPLALRDRRLPNQAHLQGSDYYRDPVLYRGTGIERLEKPIGALGYRENKYYFSRPPPAYDVTFAVQPYELWKREQSLRGNLSQDIIEKAGGEKAFKSFSSVF